MDENLIKPISPSPTGVKHASKKRGGKKRQRQADKDKDKNSNSSSNQGKVIDDYA